MASGPTNEEGDGNGGKQRFMEVKVYTRKSFKGLKKNVAAAVDVAVVNADKAEASSDAAPTTPATTDAGAGNVAGNDNGKASGEDLLLPVSSPVENGDLPSQKSDDIGANKAEAVNEPSLNPQQVNEAEALPTPPAPISMPDIAATEDSADLNRVEAEETAAPAPAPPSRVDVAVSDDPSNSNQQQVAATVPSDPAPDPNSRLEIIVSEDSSSPDQRQAAGNIAPTPTAKSPPSGNGPSKLGADDVASTDMELQKKQEARELRRKLRGQLQTVQNLVKRIEVKQVQIAELAVHTHAASANDVVNNGGAKRSLSEVASVGIVREVVRPLHHLSISVLENIQNASDTLEKEKRTPKANQFYPNSEFLLAKDKFPPAESNKKSKKKHVGEYGNGYGMGTKFSKSCASLLEKLMKHKHGWVFNEPVDAERLGLLDYHIIIKQPMDLGTIKARLTKNWYKSPKEFAEDVRLTFRNAMTYNPKGQDVHVMAEQLATIFEERWAIIESDYNREMRFGMDYGGYSTPTSRRPPPLDMRRVLDRSESMTHSYDPKRKPISITPSGGRTPALKKPKAKDLHKRNMTYDEKQKLSTNLQVLPPEKLDAILQIIKKRNSSLFQRDDEIEVDIDNVDAETLWELDRFVTNYKKSLSKNKRKAELAIQARNQASLNVAEKTQAQIASDVPIENRTEAGENIVLSSSPVHGENQDDNRSRSSSSSSSSSSGSSSSDSDSDSSSASGSDGGSPGS